MRLARTDARLAVLSSRYGRVRGTIIRAISNNKPPWMKKLAAGLSQAYSTPPKAGLTTRATLPAIAFSAIAFQRSLRGTVLATMAWRTGWIMACKAPVRKVNAMAYKTPGWTPVAALGLVPAGGMTAPRSTATAKTNTTSARAVWITKTTFRRSTRSARTPASGPMKRKGKDRMPAAMPTHQGECDISHTSQGMVNCWNQLAEALHRLLSQSNTKSRCRREVNVWTRVAPRFPPVAMACACSRSTGTSLRCCMWRSTFDLLCFKSDGHGHDPVLQYTRLVYASNASRCSPHVTQ